MKVQRSSPRLVSDRFGIMWLRKIGAALTFALPRRPRLVLAAATCLSLMSTVPALASDSRKIAYPPTRDGLLVLSIDTHAHTVFSDGSVWPDIRVMEAEQDNLDAIAITDHIDTQKHRDDIPNPDRNRSFEIATKAASDRKASVIVVRGVEIARPSQPGCRSCAHFNAIFVNDNNPLRHREWNGRYKWQDNGPNADHEASIRAAKAQDAFVIWNHPFSEQDNAGVSEHHSRLLKAGMIDGIEVANARGRHYDQAFALALERDLAIIGASDIHKLVDHSYDIAGGEQRTATLVLAKSRSEAAIKEALKNRRSVALQKDTLYGRERDIRAIVESSLSASPDKSAGPATWTIVNSGSSSFKLKQVNGNGGGTITIVPARGTAKLQAPSSATSGKSATSALLFEVVNAYVGPGQPLRISLPALNAAASGQR